jgi:predicted metal-binding membrane protein
LPALVLGIAVVAWIGTVAFHTYSHTAPPVPQSPLAPHHAASHLAVAGQAESGIGGAGGVGNWMLGWTLMVVAMMLPPALPLVRAIDRLTAGLADRPALIAWVVAVFLTVWVAAGLALYSAGTGLHSALALLPAWANRAGLFAGVAAIAAGLFQVTPLKMACMDACRSPTSVIMTHWQAATPRRSAARIGMVYGAICVGCCWALMLLSVLVGALMLPIMVVTAALMMLERLLPSVRPLIPLQAGLAIAIGALLIAGVVPPGFP